MLTPFLQARKDQPMLLNKSLTPLRLTTSPYKNRLVAIVVVLMSLLVGIYLRSQSQKLTFHPDEYDYVARGAFLDLILSGNTSSGLWQTYDSYVHEKFPSYFYRVILMLYRQKLPIEVNNESSLVLGYSWGRGSGGWCDYKQYSGDNCLIFTDNWMTTEKQVWNDEYSSKPFSFNFRGLPEQLKLKLEPFVVARRGSLFFSLGSVVLLFFVLYRMWGILAGLGGVMILVNNPLYKSSTLRAMGDGPLFFFILLSIYFGISWFLAFKANKRRIVWLNAIAVGISLGLAVSSKFNGFLGFIYFSWLAILIMYKSREISNWLTVLASTAIILFIIQSIFTILHPFVWKDPVGGTIFMIKHRILETGILQQVYPHQALTSVSERLYALLYQTIFSKGLYTFLPGTYVSLVLFIFGLLSLILSFFGGGVNDKDLSSLALFCFFSTWIVMGIYMGMNWDRYYLPFLLPITLIQARGFFIISRFLLRTVQASNL